MILNVYYDILVVLTSLWIASKDIKERRIPNESLGLLLFFCMLFIKCGSYALRYDDNIIMPITILGIGIGLSLMKLIGMGDIKLLTVSLLITPSSTNSDFIISTLAIGAIWGVLWEYCISKIKYIASIDRVRQGVPYSIPILISLCFFTIRR